MRHLKVLVLAFQDALLLGPGICLSLCEQNDILQMKPSSPLYISVLLKHETQIN